MAWRDSALLRCLPYPGNLDYLSVVLSIGETNMAFKWNLTELEIVEELAQYENMIASEEELSELFDAEIAPFVVEQYGEDDGPAMNEAFSNWSDGLQRDGVIHESQLNNYCYVGKYSA